MTSVDRAKTTAIFNSIFNYGDLLRLMIKAGRSTHVWCIYQNRVLLNHTYLVTHIIQGYWFTGTGAIACPVSAKGPRMIWVKLMSTKPHNSGVIMSTVASQITGVSVVYSPVCSAKDQRKHQSFASLAFVMGIHRSPVNSPHKGPVTRKYFHLMTSSW